MLTNPSLKILNLTRQRCLTLMDQLVAVGRDYSDWGAEEFLAELPDKFSLSFAILAEEEFGEGVIGYCIMSRKWPDKVHIHHFMIHHEKRGLGLGQVMLGEAAKRAAGLPLSLKVPDFNVGAIRFYERHGFTIDREERQIFWMLKSN